MFAYKLILHFPIHKAPLLLPEAKFQSSEGCTQKGSSWVLYSIMGLGLEVALSLLLL